MSTKQLQPSITHNSSLTRSVSIQKSSPQVTNYQLNKLKDFFNYQNIVLLGDPGAGKTRSFENAAEYENAKYIRVRDFISTKGKGCKDKVIYLDGLDEFRSRVDDKNVILALIQILADIDCKGLRLSCRAQDWLGDSDLSLLETYFDEEAFIVLNLEALREKEILSILTSKNIESPQQFIDKAISLNISTLLHNPQTLLMLIDVVKQRNGEWPKTKKELYKQSSELLLTEHNDERARSGTGEYSPNELLNTVGIACATILISGVEGISLRNNTTSNNDFPSYRELTICDVDLLLATLCRRIFSYSKNETVTCDHRTVAEFLAASWLTDQIANNNLPIKRVLSLITSEEHPTSDLRGLYAWLATLLPEKYTYLFDNDPYGVLMYGDPASLSLSSRQYLLSSLEKLKERDPWLSSGDRSDNPLGALAGKDMESAFKRILVDPDSGFHLRRIVLNAIKQGDPNRHLLPELQQVLVNTDYGYSNRSDAIEALLKLENEGINCIVDCYDKCIIKEPKSIRLRINILRHLYHEHFEPADAVKIIIDRAKQNDREHIQVYDLLCNFSELPPVSHLPEILDAICLVIPDSPDKKSWRNKTEIETCLFEMIEKILESELTFTPDTLYNWLNSIRRLTYGLNTVPKKLSQWLEGNKSFVFQMFDCAYENLKDQSEQNIIWIYSNFRLSVFHSFNQTDFAFNIADKYLSNPIDHIQIYELFGQITFHYEAPSRGLLEIFYSITNESIPEILEIKERVCKTKLEDWKLNRIQQKINHRKKETHRKQSNQQAIEETLGLIEAGKHFNNLEWLARVYYFNKNGETGKEKLTDYCGEKIAPKIINGFKATLERSDLPSMEEVTDLHAKSRYFPWWLAILAGMDEYWLDNPSFDGFSQEKLGTLLSIEIERNTGKSKRVWHKEIIGQFPELSEKVYEKFAIKALEKKKNTISVIYDLFNDDFTPPWKEQLTLKLLTKYPNIQGQYLTSLIQILLVNESFHSSLLQLAKKIIRAHGKVKKESRLVWLMTGFLLDENYFSSILAKYVKSRYWCAEKIASFFEDRRNPDYSLSISKVSLLVKISGRHVPNTENSSPFSTSGYVRDMITKLSTFHDNEAGEALQGLLQDKKLATYNNHIKHAIAEQALIYRMAVYQQPDWSAVIKSLQNGHPANIADLYALTLDQLNSLRAEILNTNTDKHKYFWNTDSHKKVTTPIVEELCRNVLIDLLRPNYNGMHVEPEGHMAQDKRADIIIQTTTNQTNKNLKLPLELKRDIHPNLWTACKNQLERMYTRDPDAQGYGIYVVFWFGDKIKGNIKYPPKGLKIPKTAQEMEKALSSLIPEDKRHCLSVVVLDLLPS